MEAPNDFIEYYKTISDTELLSILDRPTDYQPSALEAAKAEFTARKLSDTDIQKARLPLIAKQEQKDKEREKVKAVETKFKAAGQTFFETINPMQSGLPKVEKTIRHIVIVFGGIFLYQFIKDFKLHLAYLKDISSFPVGSILYLLPLMLLPIATIAFWKKKTMGWILLTVFISFSAVGVIWSLFQSFFWKPSEFGTLANLFPRPSPTKYVIQIIFLIGTMYVLCKPNIRVVFSVDKQKMSFTIGITILASLVLMFGIA